MDAPTSFQSLVASLPTRQVQVGEDSSGAPLYAEVHSLFGADEPEIEVTA